MYTRFPNGGGTSTFLRNTRVLNVTMRMFGCPAAPRGSRSGISFQKGIIDYELGHFYVRGQKNSPFDCEPSAASVMSGFNIHDGTFNNADGKSRGCCLAAELPTSGRAI